MRLNTLSMSFLLLFASAAFADSSGIQDILAGKQRSPEHRARDQYRHPAETIAFFGLKPNMTVVEIWPGGDGWYTEILAPYVREKGKLYAAHFSEDSPLEYFRNSLKKFIEKTKAEPEIYDKVEITAFSPPRKLDVAPDGVADYVVTFRNVHNWYMRGGGDESVVAAFKGMYKALKPGGMLGVVEHRLPANRPLADQEKSGYMREDYVIKQAEAAGFKLVEKSEVNANPKDTADHPEGVWTLPPRLRLGDKDRERYLSIGESDRMTLKFTKPEKL